ncbi:MAG: acetate--CoA ligase family protein [Rhodospirillaceae bacterium]|jgi:acetate---CoA ligase (ADP-forming)|nr:acetate--CoA ligase family protein [Rhodospirillaceae bacterium]MBT5456589.1 acetate--CoA ligase family protein [Rhodospirillaceae bacterium]
MDKDALDALLKPRSAAIVGASPKRNVGGRIYRNMIRCGFDGALYPVNPGYESVDDAICYPDMEALPETPDCVVIAVPYTNVFVPLEAAARRGVKAAVVVAEGFNDAATDDGRARQERLSNIAEEYGMAISGPNCMGLVGLKAGLGAAFTTLPEGLVTGGVSLVSQSGGLLNATIELGHNRTIGFNYLLSGGNEAVVTSADFIDWLADDPGTSVIINILEGARDGRRYREAIGRALTKKPVVLLKLGRTDTGRSAALAHTGSLAGDNAAYEALQRDYPLAVTTTIDEMVETAMLFDRMKRPAGDRVFLFSVSGGATVLAGDLARDAGLNLPPMGNATNKALQDILEVDHSFQNPMDVVGAPRLAKGDNLTRCLHVLLADDDYDLITLVMVAQRDITDSHQVLHDQYEAVMARAHKPIVLVSEMNWQPRERPDVASPYIAGTLDDGMCAIKRLIDYGGFENTGTGPAAKPTRQLVVPVSRHLTLTEASSADFLEPLGLSFARYELASSAADAGARAAELGFPVALKISSPDIAHKTEAGGIRLNLGSKEAVQGAYDAVMTAARTAAPDAHIEGVVIQEMVSGGLEMILGVTLDPQFGPLVMVGAGGTLTELIGDRAVGFPPLTREIATAMVGELRVSQLLDGWRGGPRLDRAALIDALITLSEIAAATDGQITAIDLNPVMVLPEGQGVRIVDALIIRAG